MGFGHDRAAVARTCTTGGHDDRAQRYEVFQSVRRRSLLKARERDHGGNTGACSSSISKGWVSTVETLGHANPVVHAATPADRWRPS